MTDEPDRPRFIERVDPQMKPPADARQRRASTMIAIGAIMLAFAAMGVSNGRPVALLFGILAAGLLVGGLVIRR